MKRLALALALAVSAVTVVADGTVEAVGCHGGYSTYYDTAYVYCDPGTTGVASWRVAALCDDSQGTGRWWAWDHESPLWHYSSSSRAYCSYLELLGYGNGHLNAVGWTYKTRSY